MTQILLGLLQKTSLIIVLGELITQLFITSLAINIWEKNLTHCIIQDGIVFLLMIIYIIFLQA